MVDLQFLAAPEVGRRLGHDLFRHGIGVDEERLDAAVREGWEAARARLVPRRGSDRFTRKWLQLRLGAHRRQRIVDDGVTPELLRQIDVTHCPVTRARLTHGRRQGSDWSVDRLNNNGAYAPNNLAVMSTAANLAKGERCYEHVFALSERPVPTDGLAPVEWLRMAALMLGPSFAARPEAVPVIPLATSVPGQVVRPAVQQVQQVFANEAHSAAGKNALVKHFRPTCRDERSLLLLRLFADAMHNALKRQEHACDAWLLPGVLEAFVAWHASLDQPSWALAAEVSRRLSGASRIPPNRLQTWHLATSGHTPHRFTLSKTS